MTDQKQKILIVLGGPTASGKTALAIQLAQHFGTAIVSADSRQFYREMGIGTAKPSAEELTQAPHYLINSLSVQDAYNVGKFEQDALGILAEIFSTHQVAVLTGGSGLFLKAICEGLDVFPEAPDSVREAVDALYREGGLIALQKALLQADPEYYAQVDLQNPHRLLRALTVCRASGQPFSSFRSGKKATRDFRPVFLELSWPRAELYHRIDSRVTRMMEQGLEAEARALRPYRNLTALQTVGYQELFQYFEGEISQAEAVARIQRNSRRYAKRQLTWSRRDGYWKHVHPAEWEAILAYLAFVFKSEAYWSEGIFSDGQTNWTRLCLHTAANGSGYMDYVSTRKGIRLKPGPWPGNEMAQWLMHEMRYRAEGVDIQLDSDYVSEWSAVV